MHLTSRVVMTVKVILRLKMICTKLNHKCIIMLNILHDPLVHRSDAYLERLLPSQLLCGGGTVLLNTIKHPGLRLKEERNSLVRR